MPTLLPSPDLPEAVRLQIRATEHSSLLATRNITYTAVFGRASILKTSEGVPDDRGGGGA